MNQRVPVVPVVPGVPSVSLTYISVIQNVDPFSEHKIDLSNMACFFFSMGPEGSICFQVQRVRSQEGSRGLQRFPSPEGSRGFQRFPSPESSRGFKARGFEVQRFPKVSK